jgi:hypothetical protein
MSVHALPSLQSFKQEGLPARRHLTFSNQSELGLIF